MELKELEKRVRLFLKGEYATDKIYDQLYRIAVLDSQTGDLAKFVYHDPKYNPEARIVGTFEDEVSISGEAVCHLIALMMSRGIDLSDALEAGIKKLEEKDGYKKKGEVIEIDNITTLKGYRTASGIVEGIAIVILFASEKKLEKLLTNLKLKDEKKILVTESLSAHSVSVGFLRAINLVGIVTNQGGSTSHGAIIAREMGIPCVSGTEVSETEKATKIIHSGDKIIVNGNAGEVVLIKREVILRKR
ncbi:hypothetical protein KAU51_01795 [Candidatus Parcubacteria bacterium]|nr:hypothetical protein [Candidatus Parcubacteria bacterium]